MRKYRFKRAKLKAAQALEIPQEVLLDTPSVTINGNVRVYIDNHSGLVEYTPEQILLKTSDGTIKVMGKDMGIDEFEHNRLVISGTIKGVYFGGKNIE
jgi:sporulation protein YqfC